MCPRWTNMHSPLIIINILKIHCMVSYKLYNSLFSLYNCNIIKDVVSYTFSPNGEW